MRRSEIVAASALALGTAWAMPAPAAAEEARPIEDLMAQTHVHGLALDPQDPGRLLVATHHGLLALDLGTGLVSPVGESRQDFMGFSVAGPERLLASGHPEGGGNSGVLLSEDGGVTWTKLSDGVEGPVDFHQMTASGGTLYGAYAGELQRSRDGGLTWELVAPAPDGLIDLAASTADAGRLFAATETGLLLSEDGGASWAAAGRWEAPVSFVEAGPGPVVHAFVLGEGLVRAEEGSLADWTTLAPPMGDDYLLHFATDGVRAFAVTGSGAVLASEDGGASWTPFGG